MNQPQDRWALLHQIRSIVGDTSDDGRVQETLIFCIRDVAQLPAQFWQPEGYLHEYQAGGQIVRHIEERAFIFHPKTKWEFREDGEVRHFSVGTILKRQGGKGEEYLLFRRRMQPAGCYTIPAGHLEIGETPEEGARREGYEETQLGILSAEYFYEGEIQGECRRGSNWHYWYLYLCQCVGEARLPDEADVIGWFSRDEIIKELKLTKPAGIFFNKLFGEEPHHITNG